MELEHLRGLLYSQCPDYPIHKLQEGFIPENCDITVISSYLSANGIRFCTKNSTEYPFRLQSCPSKPWVLYYQGCLDVLLMPQLAVVGPRMPSVYAKEVLSALFESVQGRKCCIVSGGARGVDLFAHEMALKMGIPTVVVLGGGFDYYLKSAATRSFFDRVVQGGGLVISEFRLFQQPTTYTFPQRNRIVASLCDVLFVPEAGKGSGSLITLEIASKIGRPIFGAPGSIFWPQSAGLNKAFEQFGVKPVLADFAFLDQYFPIYNSDLVGVSDLSLSPIEQLVLEALSQGEQVTFDQLLAVTRLAVDQLMVTLTGLELRGLVGQEEQGVYYRMKNGELRM